MPGCFIAAVRHNRPTIIVYGGTIQAGVRHLGKGIQIFFLLYSKKSKLSVAATDCPSMGFHKGGTVNVADAFESYGLSR
jgi:dihydroxy-acid dehydratase